MPYSESVILRDPLYGYIDLSDQEIQVLDTAPVQRLRGIKQVAHTYLVYPSAIHTRFTHSLGTMHVAGLVADQLGLTREQTRLVRLSALLHDVGHGPFSHLFEELSQCATGTRVDHELVGRAIIQTSPALRRALGADRRAVIEILAGNKGVMSKIISGGVDSDKMDYFRRDSFHAGVRYGQYDFDRILRTLKRHNEHIVVPEKGWDAMDGFLLAREQLYLQVYYHHARIIADEMLKRVVELASRSGDLQSDRFRFDPENPAPFLARFMEWDDTGFMNMLGSQARGPAAELLEGLANRRLLKRGYYCDVKDIDAVPRGQLTAGGEQLREMEQFISRRTNSPPHQIFAKIPAISMKQYYLKGREELYALRDTGKIENFLDVSKIKGPSDDLLRLIVFGPGSKRHQIEVAAKQFINSLE